MILRKSFKAPFLRCGMDSDTMDISISGVLAALSISIGIIPNVFPAEFIYPCVTTGVVRKCRLAQP